MLSVGDIYKYGFEDYKQTDLEPFTLYGGTVGYGAGIVQDTYILSERGETYGKMVMQSIRRQNLSRPVRCVLLPGMKSALTVRVPSR